MSKLPITRTQAFELIKKYNKDERDLIHYLESEAVMRELASKLGEDVDYYGMLGLLHDIDWGLTKDNPKTHMTKAPEILKKTGFDNEFIEIILSHAYGFDCGGDDSDFLNKKRTKKIEFALAASETITGLIHAYALMRQGRISDMEVSGLKKKFKDKTFAAAVDREIIRECENLQRVSHTSSDQTESSNCLRQIRNENLGLTLDEFFKIAIEGIKKIKEEVGLS